MSFVEVVGGVEYIQAIKIGKLLAIPNTSQFLDNNKIVSRKFSRARTSPWYISVSGAIQMLVKRNFGGNEAAAALFYRNDRLKDSARVCLVLEFLEAQEPGILDLKPAGRKIKGR